MRINQSNVKTEIKEINKYLKTYRNGLRDSRRRINMFVKQEDMLISESFNNARAYYLNNHYELHFLMIALCDLMMNTNKMYASKLSSAHPNILDEADINAKITKLENLATTMENEMALMPQNKPKAGGRHSSTIPSTSLENQINANQVMIERLKSDLVYLKEINTYTKSLYTDTARAQSQINTALSKLTDAKRWKNGDFNPNSLVDLTSSRDALNTAFKNGFDTDLNIYYGDPVNMATGNYVYEKEFFKSQNDNDLSLKFIYNSISDDTNEMGNCGWSHNYLNRAVINENEIFLKLSNGREELYRKHGIQYVNSLGYVDRSLKIKDDGIIYTDDHHSTYHFDDDGKILKIETLEKDITLFSYEDEKLISVDNNNDSKLLFEYEEETIGFNTENDVDNSKHKQYVLKKITEQNGRVVLLNYKDGNLVSITNENGNSFIYEYDESDKMLSVTNPVGITTVKNTYDGNYRMIKQEFPDEGVMEYRYEDNNQLITFIDQCGNSIKYFHDSKLRNIKTVYPDGTEEYEYNDQNQKIKETDKNGNVTKHSYTKFGQLSQTTNPLDEVTHVNYDNKRPVSVSINNIKLIDCIYNMDGYLSKITDGENRTTEIEYGKTGKPVKLTNPDGTSSIISYDPKGNINEVIDGSGTSTKYEYDKFNRVSKAIDGNGYEQEYKYDLRGNILEVKNADGSISNYEYSPSDLVTKIVDFDGYSVIREYNELNKLAAEIDKNGNTTEYEYDKRWNVNCIKKPTGEIIRYKYDALNRLESVIRQGEVIEKYKYDPNGNIIKKNDALGNATKYEYDSLNRVRKIIYADGSSESVEYDFLGNIIKHTNQYGNVSFYEYNKASELIKETDPKGNVTDYEYTKTGEISKEIKNDKLITSYEYFPGGLLKKINYPNGNFESFEYDNNKNIVNRTDQDGYDVNYVYDPLNRIIEIDDSQKGQTKLKYDPLSNVIETIDAENSRTQYKYSPNGELLTVIDALGNTTEYDYDKGGNLTAIKQVDEKLANALRITAYKRDPLGRVTNIMDPLGGIEEYEYDPLDRVTEKIDKEGFATHTDYDVMGNISSIKYENGNEVKYRYDALKKLIEMEDWLGKTVIERDMFGREKSIIDHRGKKVGYSYDMNDNRTSVIYPDGKEVNYRYNDLGFLEKVTAGNQQVNYSYHDNGQLSRKEYSNGLTSAYEFYAGGEIKSLSHSNKAGLISGFSYEYDNMGNKSKIEKINYKNQTSVSQFTYDPLGRIRDVMNDDEILRTYEYDSFGNRSKTATPNGDITFEYNELNQLTRKESKDETIKYSYDKRGNLTEIMNNDIIQNTFEFGDINRMTKAINKSGKSANYSYNGLGLRTAKEIFENNNPASEIEVLLDQTKAYSNILGTDESVQNGSFKSQAFIWDGNPLFMEEEGKSFGLIQDELGSMIGLSDNLGNLKEIYDYDEFGLPSNNAINSGQPFGYTGYEYDPIAGTYFAQAREYLPDIGRFTGRDIVKGFQDEPITLNEYTYCLSNPKKYVDKDGQWITIVVGAIIGGVAGGISNVYDTVRNGKKFKFSDFIIDVGTGAVIGGVAGTGVGLPVLAGVGAGAGAANYSLKTTINKEWYKKSPKTHVKDIGKSILSWGASAALYAVFPIKGIYQVLGIANKLLPKDIMISAALSGVQKEIEQKLNLFFDSIKDGYSLE